MGSRINNVCSFHEAAKQKAVNDSIGSCISTDDIPLRVDAIGIGVRPARKIHWNAIAVDYKSPVSIAVGTPVTAHRATLRVEAAEKRKARTGTINGPNRTLS